jgi:hypothetical protein
MMTTATALVARMERALRFYRYTAIAGAAVIALMIAGGVGLYETQQQQCQAGNSYRAADAANWDDVLAITFDGSADPRAAVAAGRIRSAIHHRDAPRACPGLLRLLP